jgi:UPF0755 protein
MRRALRNLATLALVPLIAAVVAGVWFRAQIGDDRLPESDTVVVIPDGATGHDVARLLEREKIVSSAFAFDLLARLQGERSSMKAGEFRFEAHRPMTDVLHEVVTGGQQVAVWVTLPEGFTAKQIAQTLAAQSLGETGPLEAAFFGETLELGGARTKNLEGYLFPDTYLVPTNAKPEAIAKLLTDQFRRELPPDAPALARRLGLTVPQVVTVASLVESEAKADDERALMAGVYYNRLKRGMALQVDAAIEYTFAHHKDVITYADLARDSPYNTYRNRGLPPTPIANPGRASLLAAFHPRHSDYLYYVAMGNGHSAFARTLEEHNANVARYLK